MDGYRLRDPAADVVADQARGVDPQMIEDGDQTVGVRPKIDGVGAKRRWIAAPKAEEIENDDAVSRGQ